MLAKGLATPSEIATLALVSRQLVESWAKAAHINWREAKAARLLGAWLKEIDRGHAIRRQVRRRRARMRATGSQDAPRHQGEEALADPVSCLPAQGGGMDDEGSV